MKYQKKPVVVEAEQWFPGKPMGGVCCAHPAMRCPLTTEDSAMPPHVHTAHNGQMVLLEPGDWIIQESNYSGYYPIKPDIFEETYEPVDEV